MFNTTFNPNRYSHVTLERLSQCWYFCCFNNDCTLQCKIAVNIASYARCSSLNNASFYSNHFAQQSHYYCNNVVTKETGTVKSDNGFIKKFFKKVGWLDHSKTRLKLSGYFLYEAVPDKVNYEEWFTTCSLPDTFASWFAITELHVWVLMVRCMAEDIQLIKETGNNKNGEGRFLRNSIVEALWADVANRIKHLEGVNPSIARGQVAELSEQFQAAIVGYDEGLESDTILAGALWRRLFSRETDDVEAVEKAVKFIRRQIAELDKISSETLITKPTITWVSINDK